MGRESTDGQKDPHFQRGAEIDGRKLRALVRAAARRIVTRTSLSEQDLPDIEQTLRTALLEAHRRYDPKRGSWYALASSAVRRAVKNFLRHRFTPMRDPRLDISLDVSVAVDDRSEDLANQVTYDDKSALTGRYSRSAQELAELALDTKSWLESLPEPLRQLAMDLMHMTEPEISRATGTPRSTIQYRRKCLKAWAEDQGLSGYL